MELYGRRNSSNVAPVLWCLEELGLACRRHDVGGSFGGLDTPAFRALNPNGRIPVLDDDGFVLWESNAIIRYLAEAYGEGGLGPRDARERALNDPGMQWYKTSLYPPLIALYQSFIWTEPEARDAGRMEQLARTVADLLRVPEGVLRHQDYLVGEEFGIGDIPLGAALYRYVSLPVHRPRLEGVERWYARLCERPAYRTWVMRPFGLTPAEFLALERAGAQPAPDRV